MAAKAPARARAKKNSGGGNFPPGPRKQRPPGVPEARHTTHKNRARWFQARAAWPVREAPVHALVAERTRAARSLAPHAAASSWELVGPTNVGGRMTSIVCDPHNVDLIWAGAAGGGVWKSTDGGQHWRALWHAQPTLNIGALAIDPGNPQILYCGTGEADLSADSYPGVGLYRSLDGGENWQILAATDTARIPNRIGTVAVDPFDANHLRIGGVTHAQGGQDGMFVSRNGGVSWARETFAGSGPHRCHMVLFHPRTRGTLYATIDARGSASGIWKSTNGGARWTHLTSGLPPSASIGRASLAIAPSSPSVIYAIASDSDDHVLGVFRSADAGASWKNIAGTSFRKEGQMSYGNAIAVHPTNPDHVLCGGVDLHLTRNAGKTWIRATHWDADPDRGATNYAHADHHFLLMPAGRPGLVYDMNDGGMDVSGDGGKTWTKRSNGLAVTMFYDVDVAQSDGRIFGGGAQDNGTNVTETGKPDAFKQIDGGDGGWILIDPTTPGHRYTTSQNMVVTRFRNGGWADVSPPASGAEQAAVWMIYLDMDPGDPRTVFAGGLRVWRTKNDGAAWQAVSSVLDGSAISAIEIAPGDPKTVYVGTENGGFFRSGDGGDSWSADLSSSVHPGFTITRIAASPTDAQIVFTTVANFGASHVFRSSDGGQSWSDVDRGRLPDVPHHAIAVPRAKPATIYLGNDAGVFISNDSGGTWKNLTGNLPTAPIVDLVYHDADGTLTAASYGRSCWRLKI
jgi:photosystem II stability/assembly factor-like uncharacterized protein